MPEKAVFAEHNLCIRPIADPYSHDIMLCISKEPYALSAETNIHSILSAIAELLREKPSLGTLGDSWKKKPRRRLVEAIIELLEALADSLGEEHGNTVRQAASILRQLVHT